MINNTIYYDFVKILKEELIPALGCTEPIAIAYAAAKARAVLGSFPDRIIVECSGNIVKNVKSVIVPNTVSLKGINTSAILGVVGGNESKGLEVLSDISKEDINKTEELLKSKYCEIKLKEGVANLYIKVTAFSVRNTAVVTIVGSHTNITKIEKNGICIFSKDEDDENKDEIADREYLTIDNIYEFANTVKIDDIKEVLDKQVNFNLAIAKEGLTKKYGANIGAVLIESLGNDVQVLAKAYAAAGSDARMSGCELPVIINSGSGNQGLTVSLPVIVYARHFNVSEEKLYRALTLSNLIAIHLKTGIGKLSAFCGAVSAACGSGAGIAYIQDSGIDIIKQTIINTLGNVSGIVCDGAKASCAAKIASSVDAAILGYNMAVRGRAFKNGDGLVKGDVEDTIKSISRMAYKGMKDTDVEILNIMIDK